MGTTFTITARVGPFKAKAPYEVTIWVPSTTFGGSGVASPVTFSEEYSLAPDGDGERD